MKKYEIIDIKHPTSPSLHRIRALRDIPRYGVKAGNFGGYIVNESNLSQDGDCWIGGDAAVFGNARIYENAGIGGMALVYGDACVFGNAIVCGETAVCHTSNINGNVCVPGDCIIINNLTANMKVERSIWKQSISNIEWDRVQWNKEIHDVSWHEVKAKINVKEWIC